MGMTSSLFGSILFMILLINAVTRSMSSTKFSTSKKPVLATCCASGIRILISATTWSGVSAADCNPFALISFSSFQLTSGIALLETRFCSVPVSTITLIDLHDSLGRPILNCILYLCALHKGLNLYCLVAALAVSLIFASSKSLHSGTGVPFYRIPSWAASFEAFYFPSLLSSIRLLPLVVGLRLYFFLVIESYPTTVQTIWCDPSWEIGPLHPPWARFLAWAVWYFWSDRLHLRKRGLKRDYFGAHFSSRSGSAECFWAQTSVATVANVF